MAREFPTAVVIIAATGMLIAEFSPVHEFYEYMAGEPVFTHQISRLAREVKPVLLERHPELAPTYGEASRSRRRTGSSIVIASSSGMAQR